MAKRKAARPTRKAQARKPAPAARTPKVKRSAAQKSKLLKSPKTTRKPTRNAKAQQLLKIGSKKTPPKQPAGKVTTTRDFEKAPVKLAAPRRTQGNLTKTEPNVESAPLPGPVPMMPKVGEPAPDFELPDAQGETVRLSDMRGQKVVVYFYPKDDSPGCTIEAQGFSEDSEAFEERGVVVLGISKDDVRSHAAFTTKCGLKVRLLSDTSTQTIQDYGCWVEKNNYGNRYMGTQRATFLIDEEGRVMKVWPKVTPEGHSKEILAALEGRAGVQEA